MDGVAARGTGNRADVPPTPPTRDQLQAAYGARVSDLVAPDLRVLLVGVNPSLWSGVTGFHFGRPANRLWVTLHESGLTQRRLRPEDAAELLAAGIGISNLVPRATARADELDDDELRAGAGRVAALAGRVRPGVVAFLGLGAYRTAFGRPRAGVGALPEPVGGRPAWLLPNPSGLNASWQQPRLTAAFADLHAALPPPRGAPRGP